MSHTTAHSLATSAVPTCSSTDSASVVLDIIQRTPQSFDSIDYIYVLDDGKLMGVFSIHELFSARPSAKVSDFMTTAIAAVHTSTDTLHIAELALAQNIKAVPVVDEANAFVGTILANDVLRIIGEAHTSYLYKATGIHRKSTKRYHELGFLAQVRTRTPWLIFGLFGGVAGAAVVNFFERSLAEQVFVAAFIPAIVYIADAVGNQTEMLVVRALGREHNFRLAHYLMREWVVGFSISGLLALLMFGLSFLWLHNSALSTVLGLSILATVSFTILFTVLLPWSLKRLGFDPAVASGPLATVFCDVSSVTIYLLIAAAVL
ncbi:MAG: hypothetical protein RLZZ480_510 [Candidatus Parcubacteria bacterium]|jgi:magnesium transporter